MSDLFVGMQGIMKGAWSMLTGVTIPGTGITFAMLFLGLAFIDVGILILSLILGVGFGGSDTGGAGYGSRGSKHAKIDKARKDDDR